MSLTIGDCFRRLKLNRRCTAVLNDHRAGGHNQYVLPVMRCRRPPRISASSASGYVITPMPTNGRQSGRFPNLLLRVFRSALSAALAVLARRPANHLLRSEVRGLSSGPALLSGLDRLSAPDRRSPTSCFSTSDRVSVPDRRSFEVRLPSPDRFSSLPIVVSVGLPRIMLDRAGLSHENRP